MLLGLHSRRGQRMRINLKCNIQSIRDTHTTTMIDKQGEYTAFNKKIFD